MPIPLLLAAAPGLIKAGASLFGSGKRKREQQAAQRQFNADQASLRQFNFENTYANQENVFEDARVNTQATEFQAQQNDQALAQGLNAAVSSNLGGVSAQAFANASLQADQGLSADIARQEEQNQARTRAFQGQLNQQEAAGADFVQTRGYQKNQQLVNLSAGRLGAANQARERATAQLAGGLGDAFGGVLTGGLGNLDAGKSFFGSPITRKKELSPLERIYGEQTYGHQGSGYNKDKLKNAKPNIGGNFM